MTIPLQMFRDALRGTMDTASPPLFEEFVLARRDAILRLAEALTEAGHGAERIVGFFETRQSPIHIRKSFWPPNPWGLEMEMRYLESDDEYVTAGQFADQGDTCYNCGRLFHLDNLQTFRTSLTTTKWACEDCIDENDDIQQNDAGEWYNTTAAWTRPAPARAPLRPAPTRAVSHIPEGARVSIVPPKKAKGRLNPVTSPGRFVRDILQYSTNVLRSRPGLAFRFDVTEPLPIPPLWLGVELEVVPRYDGRGNFVDGDYLPRTMDTTEEFAILKRDGSLPSRGFEIVTVPATLAAHRMLWRRFFKEAAPGLSGWTEPSCGMHVHLARAAISDLTLGKMLVFLNKPDNIGFVERIAGRSHNTYARLHPKRFGDAKLSGSETPHYDALNVSSHTEGKTVELRIFRSNVSRGGFMKNLDFTHALVAFCREASAAQLSGPTFYSWLGLPDIQAAYPFLTQWAVRGGFISAPIRFREEDVYEPA